MSHLKYALVGLALLMSGTVQASRLQQDFSDYGVTPGFFNQNVCLDANGNPTGGTCALTAEDYLASNDPTLHVFDFKVDGAISNFTLTLTGSVPFVADPNSGTGFWAYGALLCKAIDPSFTNPPQCGPDPTSAMASGSPTLSGDGMTATFNVSGSNNDFVFFAILPEPVLDLTQDILPLDVPTEPTVTAKLTLNTSEVPEPSTLPVVLLAAGTAITVFQRRSRKLR
ncbi:MAG: PEP-CTERM sorting domain-containing protein [Acidobacteriia bacterium]|nr:PEP-CTERM sorting domain-containing protein [Terriglobia bacterium]